MSAQPFCACSPCASMFLLWFLLGALVSSHGPMTCSSLVQVFTLNSFERLNECLFIPVLALQQIVMCPSYFTQSNQGLAPGSPQPLMEMWYRWWMKTHLSVTTYFWPYSIVCMYSWVSSVKSSRHIHNNIYVWNAVKCKPESGCADI